MKFDKQEIMRQKFNDLMFYIIISLVSIVSIVLLPLLNSDPDMKWAFPSTTSGWLLWIFTRGAVVGMNLTLFYCFMQQAKRNVANHPKYKEACEILDRYRQHKKIMPLDPKTWNKKQYIEKSITLTITSIFSLVSFGQAILRFDLVLFLSCLFTVFLGLVFGWIQEKKAEIYWTDEFWLYAKLKEKEIEEEKTLKIESLNEETINNSNENEKFKNGEKIALKIESNEKETNENGSYNWQQNLPQYTRASSEE